MDPDTEINFREEIVRIVEVLWELFQRIREGDEDLIFMRWRPFSLRGDGRRRSVVRWLGDKMPRGFGSCVVCYYRSLLDSVTTRRSLVREIGSRMPLKPSKRPYFYMLHKPATELTTTRLRGVGGLQFVHSTPCRNSISPSSILWEGSNESCKEITFNQSTVMVPDDTVRKITALEDELNRLRAQIAGFVLNQEDSTEPSTQPSAIPPPPPPPPVPPLPSALQSMDGSQTPKKLMPKAAAVKDGFVMDMSTILKDLNQVKLKAVERSPGGTPLRKAPLQTKGTDPASIIAAALKSKFAKSRVAVASPDKENLQSCSPGNSFSNTPSPQPYFRKPLEHKPKERPVSDVQFKTHTIPLRV